MKMLSKKHSLETCAYSLRKHGSKMKENKLVYRWDYNKIIWDSYTHKTKERDMGSYTICDVIVFTFEYHM